ncbi:hypothetical protein HKX48_000686 [Thoreauomyces humboldtii]|nr:hypothetical protein HKX48_000686 [Thoreauomyces humboldtii]
MSTSHNTTTITLGGRVVPLTSRTHSSIDTPDLLEQVQSFPAFAEWRAALDRELVASSVGPRVEVAGVHITDVDTFGSGKLGFVKFTVDARWKKDDGDGDEDAEATGPRIPGIVFARGGAVAVLVIVRPSGSGKGKGKGNHDDDDEERVVLVVQPRLPIADLAFPELPAGMIDDDAGRFAGTAARELEEECGIVIAEDELTDLTDLAYRNTTTTDDDDGGKVKGQGVYPSPGGSDEHIRLFLCRKELDRDEIERMEGRRGGLRGEGERIVVRLVKLKELWNATRDMKALSALALYDRCLAEGLLAKK